MPVDRILVIRKMNLISEDLKRLEPLSQMSFKEYESKFEYEVIAERLLERIIGRMIDINYHVITASGFPPPRDFFYSFIKLAELGILESKFAKRIAETAGLRNRLAHEYNGIDAKKIHQAIKRCFLDMPRYLRKITDFLDKKKHVL